MKLGSTPPVRRTEKEKLKARQAAFSPTQNARVGQAISQSQNGFRLQYCKQSGHLGSLCCFYVVATAF